MRRRERMIRIRIVAGFLCVLALGLLVRSGILQLGHHDHYVTQAESQYVGYTADVYDRGSIYFTTRDGELLSAAAVDIPWQLTRRG